ncbi:MAG: cellulase family glycosylhydrolase [Anaerolineae bacterium]|nr:cellulase family glycosylhydrolase [Anaerolineae bacterium]
MRKNYIAFILLAITLLVSACGAATPTPPHSPTAPPASPTPILTEPTAATTLVTCADIDANWGRDWAAVLDTLDKLIEADQSCGEEPLLSKKYAVHFNYGAALEAEEDTPAAVEQYRAALAIDSQRQEAINALFRLDALPRPTPPACLSDSPPRPDPAPTATPDATHFVTVAGEQLQLDGQSFVVRGVNYYPRHAPWKRFFDEADPAQMTDEFTAIKEAGFNTVRIFLWYEPLFTCQPEDAIPNEAAFEIIDTIFDLAEARDLKLILTLNDLPDLTFRPLYTDWEHYDAQTTYIVRRYRNEPTLLAWDVRNGGDFDFKEDDSRFTEPQVVAWLSHITELIKEHDPRHLITAGWDESAATAPYVDVMALQHYDDPAELPARIEALRQKTDKPLLLISGGSHSWADDPDEPQDEAAQAEYVTALVDAAESEELAGWVLWTAFDFVPPPGWPFTKEYFFGLWRTDLSAKPALEALKP